MTLLIGLAVAGVVVMVTGLYMHTPHVHRDWPPLLDPIDHDDLPTVRIVQLTQAEQAHHEEQRLGPLAFLERTVDDISGPPQ